MIIFEIQRVKIFSVTNFTNLKRKNTHYKDTIKLMLFGPIDSLPGQNTNMIFNLYLHCIMLNFGDIIIYDIRLLVYLRQMIMIQYIKNYILANRLIHGSMI